VVYSAVPALLAADPAAAESLVEPLLPHFAQYYEANEALRPALKLEGCARMQVGRVGIGIGGGGHCLGYGVLQSTCPLIVMWVPVVE
jgi:hypothetical protein